MLLALAPARAAARDYFFDSAIGSDDAEGSESRPFLSIAKANGLSFSPGDRLLFRSGQTFSGNLVLSEPSRGTPEAPIVIGTCGEGRARIDAGAGTGVWVRNAGGVVVRDLTIRGAGAGRNVGSGVRIENTLQKAVLLDYVRILHVTCTGFGGYPGAIWDGYGGPSNFGDGIFVGGRPYDHSKSGYRDVRIEDCDAFGNQYSGIYVSGAWNPAVDTFANHDVHVVNCRAHDNPGDPAYHLNHSGDGILLEEVDGGSIERSAAWQNGALCPGPSGGPVGIWAASANAVTISDCVSFANRTSGMDGGGFDLDGGVSNSVIERCTSHDNDGAGILLYSYVGSPHYFGGNIVRDNVSVNDGKKNRMAGIAIGRHGGRFEGVEIYRNTVSASSKAGSDRAVVVFGTGAQGIHFHHNLVAAADGARLIAAVSQPALNFSANAYWSGDSPFRTEFDGHEYTSLADLRDGAGQESSEGDEAQYRALASLSSTVDAWLESALAQAIVPAAEGGAIAKRGPETPAVAPAREDKVSASVIQTLGVLLPPGLP